MGYWDSGNGSLMYGPTMSHWLTSWRLEGYQGRCFRGQEGDRVGCFHCEFDVRSNGVTLAIIMEAGGLPGHAGIDVGI